MGQKLVRAKRRIRDAGIACTIPAPEQLPGRLAAVRAAIYAAYCTGWDAISGSDSRTRDLAPEALWLARLLLELAPEDPENHGLLAVMLYCEARRAAHRSATGDFVPLLHQNPRDWDAAMLAEAEALLQRAARHERPGRYQVKAALQSLHNETMLTGNEQSPSAARHV
jgi:RNA polymerase sigma-70 factor (ECF subfamily)